MALSQGSDGSFTSHFSESIYDFVSQIIYGQIHKFNAVLFKTMLDFQIFISLFLNNSLVQIVSIL